MPKNTHREEKKNNSLKNQGIKFNKEFGQHILKNPLVIKGLIIFSLKDIVSRVIFLKL
jgi:hypothetical protein